MARQLEQERIRPDLVLCSPARRTRETLERVQGAFGNRVEARLDEALYGASEPKLLACLKALPREVGSVMLTCRWPRLLICEAGHRSRNTRAQGTADESARHIVQASPDTMEDGGV